MLLQTTNRKWYMAWQRWRSGNVIGRINKVSLRRPG